MTGSILIIRHVVNNPQKLIDQPLVCYESSQQLDRRNQIKYLFCKQIGDLSKINQFRKNRVKFNEMSQKVQDILGKQAVNIEIEDFDDLDNQENERQSKILAQFELNQHGMMTSQIKDSKGEKSNNEMEVEETNNVYRPELDQRLSRMMSCDNKNTQSQRESLRSSLLRSQFSIVEIQQELERLHLSEKLKQLLGKCNEQFIYHPLKYEYTFSNSRENPAEILNFNEDNVKQR